MNYVQGRLRELLIDDEFIKDSKELNCRELSVKYNIKYDRLYYHVVRKLKNKVKV
jgi:hypothetical protein